MDSGVSFVRVTVTRNHLFEIKVLVFHPSYADPFQVGLIPGGHRKKKRSHYVAQPVQRADLVIFVMIGGGFLKSGEIPEYLNPQRFRQGAITMKAFVIGEYAVNEPHDHNNQKETQVGDPKTFFKQRTAECKVPPVRWGQIGVQTEKKGKNKNKAEINRSKTIKTFLKIER